MEILTVGSWDETFPKARLALLLDHFLALSDDREPHRVMYPLHEVLLLVTCATICSCDDFDDIVLWGKHHLPFLRRFSEFHFGVPCERWVRALFNRVDPVLFARCFESWTAALWPERHAFIAIDGKTARRTHDKRKGLKALHTLLLPTLQETEGWTGSFDPQREIDRAKQRPIEGGLPRSGFLRRSAQTSSTPA